MVSLHCGSIVGSLCKKGLCKWNIIMRIDGRVLRISGAIVITEIQPQLAPSLSHF